VKLKVRLAAAPEDMQKLESGMEHLLERMGIDDVVSPEDVTVEDRSAPKTPLAMLGELSGSLEYKPEHVTIVDRIDKNRTEGDIAPGCVFLEYEDEFVTAHHYDAAIEAMTKPEDPVFSDRFKNWFRIKPVEKFDFESLRREIERYAEVMMAA
jgi:hypothetical protein